MITIAENAQYSLKVDISKNRAFLKINGFWRNKEDIPGYLHDWDEAIHKLTKDFTLLTDATDMTIHPGDVRDVHSKAQEKIINAGVKKVAELHSKSVASMQLDGVSSESGMPKKNFNNKEEALKWLDA
ncbi:hypothetical protein MATR_02450 [Marivirga tractuosa]|uniref:STAS/SEC14 domain-containing protein n=1 Tax=Marivirga tractuosa (strain ATCC 23168 / DSM 4126 / NBRC 15989 / NCIMB 1408 / VKM B-1430 / H-43) TaxID=643867 RepID=E4TV25_MARTH|nr:hypothetical protein [Marivirga tractuosa]ADR22118.1 hypothetical protein Ftrac_2136 [Marivirga tractuosa DSM 4126]BDD13420.1 hypothetical protein MATR_02450 [Marivirga tractuosa]